MERRWKSTGKEEDRVAYRKARRDANTLIDASRNRHRYERIMEASSDGDSRRVWSAVKELLHGESGPNNGQPDEDAAFSTLLATFFVNKVRNIKSLTAAKIANCVPVPTIVGRAVPA